MSFLIFLLYYPVKPGLLLLAPAEDLKNGANVKKGLHILHLTKYR